MIEFEFTLIIKGSLQDDSVVDSLFDHGCGDATFGVVDGVGYGEFHREASGLGDAIFSSIADVESVEGLQVLHIEPDDLATASEIASKLGRTRESVRLLIAGERGKGDFPAPVSHVRSRNRLWRWSDVARWAKVAAAGDQEQAELIAAINAALELRARSGALQSRDKQRLKAIAR